MCNYGCALIFYVFIFAVTPRNTRLFQVYSLIIDPKEGSYYNTGQQIFWPMR